MKSIHVTIEGATPLLCNRFADTVLMTSTEGNKLVLLGEKGSSKERAQAKLYLGQDGKPMVPQPNLLRCLIDAGKYFQHGKSKVAMPKSSLLPTCLEIVGLELPIEHRQPWTVDTRAVRIPGTSERILCHRPCFHDWKLRFTLNIDADLIHPKLVREIVDAAGKRVGLGDFRPDCKGPFGKFVVTHWEEAEEGQNEAA